MPELYRHAEGGVYRRHALCAGDNARWVGQPERAPRAGTTECVAYVAYVPAFGPMPAECAPADCFLTDEERWRSRFVRLTPSEAAAVCAAQSGVGA